MSLEGLGLDSVSDHSPAIQNTYVVGSLWARRFTAGWTGLLTIFIIFHIPTMIRSLRSGRLGQRLFLSGDKSYFRMLELHQYQYIKTSSQETSPTNLKGTSSVIARWSAFSRSLVQSFGLIQVPVLALDLGQLTILGIYFSIMFACLTFQSDLLANSNRAGFLALAQLPAIFLFGVKNSPIHWLLGRGYEALNILHRWSGRGMWLMATLHGSLWGYHYTSRGLTTVLAHPKSKRGMVAYAFLSILSILSLRSIRRRFYNLFFVSHILATIGFLIAICYHTPFVVPWIYPAVIFYALDLLTRLIRSRLQHGVIKACDEQMTLIHIPVITGGWAPGQHVNLRVFFTGKDGAKVWESHSLTIVNAPVEVSASARSPSLSSTDRLEMPKEDGADVLQTGMLLGVGVVGSWSQAFNSLAQSSSGYLDFDGTTRALVHIDGPYGGPSIDFATFEKVLLVAGGSGVTFTLGLLDDLVGRIARLGRPNGERTRNILFVWYIRSFGALSWFEAMLKAIAEMAEGASMTPPEGTESKGALRLEFKIFVTRDGVLEDGCISKLPNSCVELGKPPITDMLDLFIHDSPQSENIGDGGVGVAASGPGGLVRATQTAVAKVGAAIATRVGGIGLHTESFSL